MNHDSPPSYFHAASPDGALAVTTTPEGVPIGIRIGQGALAASLDVVAAQLMALCALARGSGGYRRRLELASSGTPAEVLDALALPDRGELLRLEEDVDRWYRAGARR